MVAAEKTILFDITVDFSDGKQEKWSEIAEAWLGEENQILFIRKVQEFTVGIPIRAVRKWSVQER